MKNFWMASLVLCASSTAFAQQMEESPYFLDNEAIFPEGLISNAPIIAEEGVKFSTAMGADALDSYKVTEFTTDTTSLFTTAQTVSVKAVKVGRMVTLTLGTGSISGATDADDSAIEFDTALPTEFLPSDRLTFPIQYAISENGTGSNYTFETGVFVLRDKNETTTTFAISDDEYNGFEELDSTSDVLIVLNSSFSYVVD